jgi:uncharacterized membrane protein
MANLTAWKFESPDGASQAVRTLKELQDEGLIVVHSAAIVEWPQGNKKPKTRQVDDMTGPEAVSGAFWGFLFGILFFVPVFGMAVGAGMGAIMGKITKSGIDKEFQSRIQDMLTPGTSALFLVVEKVTPDKAVEGLSRFGGTVLKSSLSKDAEHELQDALHGAPAA